MSQYPVLTLSGPRQSGKTTLVRTLFKDFSYSSLEDPDVREVAKEDPRGFLNQVGERAIIDEVQRVPGLTSYLQTIVDGPKNKKKFVKLAAGRVGQLINASSLSNEVGVTSPVITKWVSALKSTFICFTLPPHFKNFNKRIVKTSKLYFYDTGLLCYLLGIKSAQQLDIHPLRGSIFENFIISESIKSKGNKGKEANYYFWRDQKGHEVDLIEERSNYLFPTEIKLSETFHSKFTKNIEYINKLQELNLADINPQGEIVYCGSSERSFKNLQVKNWLSYLTQS